MSGDWGFKYDTGVVGEWPKNGFGEPDAPAFLEHLMTNESELSLRRNMLWAFGVPSICRYPGDGTLGKVVLGVSGFGADIFVPEGMLEDAKNIINSTEIINEEE